MTACWPARSAIVTGGGTNLGRQAAAELLACGARVVIAGRREEVLAAAAAELGGGLLVGGRRHPRAGDAARIVAGALERHGRLDVLVNNAGGQYFVPAEAIAAKGWRAVMRLNVEGTMTMTRAAEAALASRAAGGAVVNVTVSPHHGMPAMAHTGAARAAVEALTVELAERWRAAGVAVVAAAIGRFDTESLRKYPEVVWRSAALQRAAAAAGDDAGVRVAGGDAGVAAGACAERDGRDAGRGGRQLVGRRGRRRRLRTTRGWCRRRRASRGSARSAWVRLARLDRPVHSRQACGRGVNGCTGAFQALGAGSSPVARSLRPAVHSHGEWRSLVAHPAGGRAVAGSNPVSPIEVKRPALRAFCVGRASVAGSAFGPISVQIFRALIRRAPTEWGHRASACRPVPVDVWLRCESSPAALEEALVACWCPRLRSRGMPGSRPTRGVPEPHRSRLRSPPPHSGSFGASSRGRLRSFIATNVLAASSCARLRSSGRRSGRWCG